MQRHVWTSEEEKIMMYVFILSYANLFNFAIQDKNNLNIIIITIITL